jgi:aryl-alcohol dehydrogenase-like predicted oxidoreductase
LRLSLVGLGCNNFGARIDYRAAEKVVGRAIDLGINHFDTADIYGEGRSEEFLGRALGPRRNGIVLATKFGLRTKELTDERRGSRAYVAAAVEASLRRLGTDWIDLLTMHVPDRTTPIEETLGALEDLRRAGKVRHYAASNFKAREIAAAAAAAARLGAEGFVGCQDEWSLLNRKIERRPLREAERLGLGVIPYRPLAGGALTGKYRRDAALPAGSRYAGNKPGRDRFLEPHWVRIEALERFAEARGHTLLELAMSWLAHQPSVVSIIAGATTPGQLEDNVRAADWTISPAEMAEIDGITATGWRRVLHFAGLAGLPLAV